MINYELAMDEDGIEKCFNALELFAYKILRYQHPTWIDIPEEEIVKLLNEEGLYAYIEE